jgi:hypothetical protein
MKNMTIYLAKVTKSRDYDSDIIVEFEAFDSMEKAETFMLSVGMKSIGYGMWENPINPFEYDGKIVTLEVK